MHLGIPYLTFLFGPDAEEKIKENSPRVNNYFILLKVYYVLANYIIACIFESVLGIHVCIPMQSMYVCIYFNDIEST